MTASLAGQSLEKEKVNQSPEESEPESRKGWTRVCISVNKSLEKGEPELEKGEPKRGKRVKQSLGKINMCLEKSKLYSEKSEPEPASESGQDWASLEQSESESWKKFEKEWTRVCKSLSSI